MVVDVDLLAGAHDSSFLTNRARADNINIVIPGEWQLLYVGRIQQMVQNL